MGKLNSAMRQYLSNGSHFADLFNGVCFRGKQRIKAEELLEASEQYAELESNAKLPKSVERTRDLKKLLRTGGALRILAIENQNLVDYTMPFRCMEYDTMEYRKQIEDIKRNHRMRNNKGLRSAAERLSGFAKEDKLFPVYTICLYHGEEPWDGPRTLKEMMHFENTENEFAELFADYPLCLYCINEETDFSVFRTELRELFKALIHRRDKAALKKILLEDKNYRCLHADTVEALSVLLNAPKIWEEKERYMQKEKEEEEYDMCQALREWMEEERAEGKEEGREEGIKALVEICKELGASQELTVMKIMQKYAFSEENAHKYVEQYWEYTNV